MTIFLDNTDRKAPAEFNGDDTLDVTRRIEREAGSAYRINGKEVRARDVRILFEDAATGARSPALVRQGQIGEIVNAKPEQRRRILEDAAGIAGLHSRRHEAELRLKAAEAQPGAAQRRAGPAQLADREPEAPGPPGAALQGAVHRDPQARRGGPVPALAGGAGPGRGATEAELAAALEKLGRATEAEAKALRAEAEAAERIQPLREQEAAKARRAAPLQGRAGEPGARGAAHRRAPARAGGRVEQLSATGRARKR